MLQQNKNQFSGLLVDLPTKLPSGSIFVAKDTEDIYIYGADEFPISLKRDVILAKDKLEEIENIQNITGLSLSGNSIRLDFVNNDGTLGFVEQDLFNLQESEIKYNVQNYTELLTVTAQSLYDFAYVRESEGVQWLPGSLLGTYYGSGLYMWNGTSWIEDDTEVFSQLETLISNINLEIQQRISSDNALGVRIDDLDHESINNKTFEQFLAYVKSLDPNPVFSYTAGLLTSITYNWNANTTTLTLSYDGNDVLQTLTLSGTVETGINTVKTLNYTGTDLTSITYS